MLGLGGGWRALAWVAIGLAWYLAARVRNPELVRQVGSRFERAS